jgi:septal ring factor EnvC (AmiA/AmiB activator)
MACCATTINKNKNSNDGTNKDRPMSEDIDKKLNELVAAIKANVYFELQTLRTDVASHKQQLAELGVAITNAKKEMATATNQLLTVRNEHRIVHERLSKLLAA